MTDQDAHEILPGLWLGNAAASMDCAFIQENGIQAVFNCTKTQPFHSAIPIQYRIPVDDNLKEEELRNMELWCMEVAFRILSEYRQGRVVLVHCMAGIQRSAAAVAMTLIAHLGIHADQAMQMIQQIRPIAFRPKPNFIRAITTFDRRFHSEILPEINRQSRGAHE